MLDTLKLSATAVILLLAVGVSAVAQEELTPGTEVFAEWSGDSWRAGTIVGVCDEGYRVGNALGETKCIEADEVVADLPPDSGHLWVGASVLAQWEDGRFYPGVIISIGNDAVEVRYREGDSSTVAPNQIRMLPTKEGEGYDDVDATSSASG